VKKFKYENLFQKFFADRGVRQYYDMGKNFKTPES